MRSLGVLLLLGVGVLGEEVCDCSSEVDGLRQELEKAKGVAKRDSMEIADLERALSASKEEVLNRDTKLEEAMQARATESERLEEIKKEVEKKEQTAHDLENEKENIVKEKVMLNDELKAAKEKIDSLLNALKEERQTKDVLQNTLEETQATCTVRDEETVLKIQDGTIAFNGSRAAIAAANRVQVAAQVAFAFASSTTKKASAKTSEFTTIASTKAEEVRATHLAPAYTVAMESAGRNYEIASKVVKEKYEVAAEVSTRQYKTAKDVMTRALSGADTDLKKQLTERNLSKTLAMYQSVSSTTIDIVQNKVPELSNKTYTATATAYARIAPSIKTASAYTASATATSIATISNASQTASTYIATSIQELPDLTVQKLLSARDTLVLSLGLDVRYANALVAAFCAGTAVLLFFVALALLRILFAWLIAFLFAFFVFAKALLAFVLFKTPIYTVTDLLPTCIVFLFKLIIVYPLKLLFSPITVPISLIRSAFSPSKKSTTMKEPAPAAAATPQQQQQQHKQASSHPKKKKHRN